MSAQSVVVESRLPRHAVFGAAVRETPGGLTVNRVLSDSPASRAGLRAGDVITAIAGTAVQSSVAFVESVRTIPAGRTIAVSVRRGTQALSLAAVLVAAPDENDPLVETLYQTVTVGGTLRRTLVTVPIGQQREETARRPAVLFIGGIGCFSVDVAANPEDAYLRLAHDLSRAGFVTLRLEKSGVGDSRGPPCPTVDYTAEAASYDVALEALRREPSVDAGKVYLFGHSIGSIIAPRMAAREPVAGVILAEGVGRNWIEYELANLRRQLVLSGSTPSEVDANLLDKEWCMHRLLVERVSEVELERSGHSCATHNAYPAPSAYFQELVGLNIAEAWMKLDAPVLVVYGTSDFITAEEDHRRIADIVNGVHPSRAEFHSIAGMDHYLDVAPSQRASMDRVNRGGPARYNDEFTRVVLGWLCKREHCRSSSS
ncbi:MAG: alpha/beta fold hydrolase [Candidatus Eremiobacteraeota bacterium]|nr:alpha/beta fold hydrolase [Candidatus Eremiobacteraeota bacterium]